MAAVVFLVAQALAWVFAAVPAFALTGYDWCANENTVKQSAAISIISSGSGEHLLVDAVAGDEIQVCGFAYDLGGTNPTAEFDYGTQTTTACDTGATAITGAMTATSRTVAASVKLFKAPVVSAVAQQLCLKLGGTAPTAVGWVTYVQKSL